MKRHDWQIEPREYARQEERRGRRFAFTSLTPARTALVVVDMIPFFVTPGSYAEGIVPNIQALVAAVRARRADRLGGAGSSPDLSRAGT